MSQSQPIGPGSQRGFPWKIVVPLLLLAMGIGAFVVLTYFSRCDDQEENCGPPPVPPVKLEIVYQEEDMLRGMNCINYGGTATYTFRNENSFPVTLAFPPLCHYTYSRTKSGLAFPPFRSSSTITWQDEPFPDDKRLVPEFARQQRDVVIPAGQSVAFTLPFNILCTDGHPTLNDVFVFGMPRTPGSHPVLGTIYAVSVKCTGTPKDVTHTKDQP